MSDFSSTDASSGDIARLIFVRIPQVVCGTLFLVSVGINIANVIGRYIFGHAIGWAEEVLVLNMMWMVFIAAGTVAFRGAHLNMDLFVSSFPRPLLFVINLVIAALFIFCCGFIAYQSSIVIRLHLANHAVSFGAGIPLAIPAIAVCFGFIITAVAVLVRFPKYLSGRFDHPAEQMPADDIPTM